MQEQRLVQFVILEQNVLTYMYYLMEQRQIMLKYKEFMLHIQEPIYIQQITQVKILLLKMYLAII